jgi:hypothetical protein
MRARHEFPSSCSIVNHATAVSPAGETVPDAAGGADLLGKPSLSAHRPIRSIRLTGSVSRSPDTLTATTDGQRSTLCPRRTMPCPSAQRAVGDARSRGRRECRSGRQRDSLRHTVHTLELSPAARLRDV